MPFCPEIRRGTVAMSDVEAKEISNNIEELRRTLNELEERLQQQRVPWNSGTLKSIGIRVLVCAERIEEVLSKTAAKEKLKRVV
jgi:hypothetical protein